MKYGRGHSNIKARSKSGYQVENEVANGRASSTGKILWLLNML